MLVLGYTVAYFLGRFAIWYSLGWFGLDERSIMGYLIYGFHQNYISYFIGFVLSIACIPKGKIILQSIYTGLLLFVWGISAFSFLTYGDSNGTPGWVLIYDGILNVLAAVTAIYMAVQEIKDKQSDFYYSQSNEEEINESV
jgi:hypothetical protein